MAIWDKVRGEFIDIVQWIDDSNDTMVYRFERYNNQIKYGAQLTVREGQAAVFVSEGKLADVFTPECTSWKPKTSDSIHHCRDGNMALTAPSCRGLLLPMRQFTDLKWGTMNPIVMRDAEFGPTRIRAFGTYVVRIQDPAVIIRQIVGTTVILRSMRRQSAARSDRLAVFRDCSAKPHPRAGSGCQLQRAGRAVDRAHFAGVSELRYRVDQDAGREYIPASESKRTGQTDQHRNCGESCRVYAV